MLWSVIANRHMRKIPIEEQHGIKFSMIPLVLDIVIPESIGFLLTSAQIRSLIRYTYVSGCHGAVCLHEVEAASFLG